MFNSYRFVTRWRLPATAERIYRLLEDIPTLRTYWPSLYKEAAVVEEGNGRVGKTVSVITKGFLPYEIRWHFRVTESNPFSGFRIEAWGDLQGSGSWSFLENGDVTDVTYVWEVSLQKSFLRHLFFLRPLLSLNHVWVMFRGKQGLLRALRNG